MTPDAEYSALTLIIEMDPPESAYGFRNIKPLTRPERLALKDKVALEKSRLMQIDGNKKAWYPKFSTMTLATGQAARMYRDNVPPEGVSLTESTPEAAGFIADADRFHSDTVGEEYLRRKAKYDRKVQIDEYHRQLRVEREGKRWEDMERQEEEDDRRWDRLRLEGVKSKNNKSGMPYNMINLRYNDDPEGRCLEYKDNITKHKAHLRCNNLVRLGDTRCGYNILTGQPKSEPVDQPPPKLREALEQYSKHK